MISNKKILILGGGGFIGSALAERLEKDNRVVIADATSFDKSIAYQRGLSNINYIEIDATDRKQILDLDNDFDYIIHAVAILGIKKVAEQSVFTINTNFLSCSYSLELASIQKNLIKYITMSTSEVYGKETLYAQENDHSSIGNPNEARWGYAASKLLSEHLAFAYGREFDIPVVVIRPFNVYGEYRTGGNAISNFVKNALEGKDLYISGTGKQSRVWCYIDDFVDGLIKVLESNIKGESFNIGNPNEECSIKDLAEKIIKITNSRSKLVITNSTEPDVLLRSVNIAKANNELNYHPSISLDEGLVKYITWKSNLLSI